MPRGKVAAEVTLQPKPRHYTAEQMERGANEHTKRAQQYRRFLAELVGEQCPTLVCELAMSMHDWALESASIPMFAFQKQRGSHALLLPDIGSTTGSVHTRRSVQELSNERLKLGMFSRETLAESIQLSHLCPGLGDCPIPISGWRKPLSLDDKL